MKESKIYFYMLIIYIKLVSNISDFRRQFENKIGEFKEQMPNKKFLRNDYKF